MASDNEDYIYRKCITLRNGKRLCLPGKRVFRIPIAKKPTT